MFQHLAVAFATLTAAAFRDFSVSSLVGNSTIALWVITSGFMVQQDTIPVYVRWIKYVASSSTREGALCQPVALCAHSLRLHAALSRCCAAAAAAGSRVG